MTSKTKTNSASIGEVRARHLASKYTCPRLLYNHLIQTKDPNCLSEEFNEKNKKCQKLSNIVYENWTLAEP